MAKRYEKLWTQCQEMIRQTVTEQQYKTWFEPIAFEAYSEEKKTLLVQVPSQYVYEYLEQHFVRLLAHVLYTSFGEQVRLTYRIMVDKEHHLSQDVEAQTGEAVSVDARAARKDESPAAVKKGGAASSQPAAPLDPQLNYKQTFANFIEGESNKLSRTIALSIAEHPGRSTFNPFFLYGPSGCGKTHLLNAIGVRTKEIYPERRVLYVSARLFQIQFTDSIRQNHINDFVNFYQSIDVLIVDDIQEWVSATKTLDTFFHIFNHLFRLGKQICLASDRPPAELEGMKDRLLTRFSCGVITEMNQPDEQLCANILRAKCRRDGLKLTEEVIHYIAKNATGSVRDLLGVVNSLLAYSVVYNSSTDMRLAERVIARTIRSDNKAVTVDDIVGATSEHYKVTVAQIMGKSRKKDFVLARQVAMYLAAKHTRMPAARIGRLIGKRDHSTVSYGCTTVERRMKFDQDFASEVAEVEGKLGIKQ